LRLLNIGTARIVQHRQRVPASATVAQDRSES
jgi:hypothetical protein